MARHPTLLIFFVVASALFASSSQAADTGLEKIILRTDNSWTAPGVTLQSASDDHCTIAFDLPYFYRETVTVEDKTYQVLTLPGGGLEGEIGQPGLPTFSGLLALPIGRSVQADILAREDLTLDDVRIFPIQPEDADEFVIDDARYAAADKQEKPTVILGAPAIMHGRRVVPFVLRPVAYDPTAGTVTVSTRLEIDFTFAGEDDRNNPRSSTAALPASFASLYADRVVNAAPAALDKSAETDGLGTYLVICPDNGDVVNALQPLLDWRRRQGYQVKLATTTETGSSRTAIKSYIQTIYDSATIPLEFVVLVGDYGGAISIPTWFETISGYGGEGADVEIRS